MRYHSNQSNEYFWYLILLEKKVKKKNETKCSTEAEFLSDITQTNPMIIFHAWFCSKNEKNSNTKIEFIKRD